MLYCRDCGQAFATETPDARYGWARCRCRRIPSVEGVLVPDSGALQDRLQAALDREQHELARSLVLGRHGPKMTWLTRFGLRPTFQRFVRHRLLSDITSNLRLLPLLRRFPRTRVTKTVLAAAQWNPYMRHRFSSPSMLAVIPLLGLVEHREGLVLDAPCGMGHLSFLLSKLVSPDRMVCMDVSPASVYSTRRFFVPRIGAAIVHDMNQALPLPDAAFGAVFCADAFHYVADRVSLTREFLRILRPDGVIVIAHAHNRLRANAYAGFAMSPLEYAGLFDGFHVRLFPESYVLDAYLDNAPLDLTRRFTDAELENSKALTVVAAKSPSAFSVVPAMRERFLDAARRPRLSGLYRMRQRRDQIVFERDIPDCLRDDFAEYREVVAPQTTVPLSDLRRENGVDRFRSERALLASHVLVDVPEEY